MRLTKAQELLFHIISKAGGLGPEDRYKAPHAYRPTPPRLRSGLKMQNKLFKGHRP